MTERESKTHRRFVHQCDCLIDVEVMGVVHPRNLGPRVIADTLLVVHTVLLDMYSCLDQLKNKIHYNFRF